MGVNEMKELKTIRDILQALLDGYVVEQKFEPLNTWEAVADMCFSAKHLDDDDEYISGRYRIKTTKPSIDWSHVHPDYKYLARDEDGLVYIYKDKPHICEYGDAWLGSGGFSGASAFLTLKPGNCDWTESLVERPKE